MKLETKVDVGDEIVTLIEGKIQKATVHQIAIEMTKKGVVERYMLFLPERIYQGGGYSNFAHTNIAFRTKQELIASL